jgi:Cof subfamily protein (haloacid dehalogenase superfamily)
LTNPRAAGPCRLIVADLDGTLMGDDVTISPRVVAAAQRAMDEGAYFTVATGRMLAGTQRFAHQLRVNAPLILYQGSEMRDAYSGQILYQSSIPLDYAQEFIAAINALGLHLNVYLDDQVYAARKTPEADYYCRLNGIDILAVGDLGRYVVRAPVKMLVIADAERLDALAPALRQQFAGRLQIVRSHRLFLEAISLEANKGRGLAWLADYLQVPQAQTAAIGDNDNDAEMIQWAGLGIAMGNASEAVRRVADLIAPSVEQDGAAWAIDQCMLALCRGRPACLPSCPSVGADLCVCPDARS